MENLHTPDINSSEHSEVVGKGKSLLVSAATLQLIALLSDHLFGVATLILLYSLSTPKMCQYALFLMSVSSETVPITM